jgi:hypothetical protein
MAKKTQSSSATILYPALAIVLIFLIAPNFIPPLTPASTKPFGTFEEFFPFYMSQHQDTTCRRLHIIGTSAILFYSLFETFVIPSLILGGMIGYVSFLATRSIETGIIEGFITLFTYLFFMKRFTKTWWKGLIVPIVAYSFAWYGHYAYEHNKPATFIYPLFSLLGDFRMCFETYMGQRQF